MRVRDRFIEAEDHLLVVTRGRWGRDAALRFVDSIASECRKSGQDRVLIDATDVTGKMPDFDRYIIGTRIAAACEGIRIAAVIRAEYINKFAENVAVNRGASFFVTSSRDEALQWLMADSPDKTADDEGK